MKILRWLIMLVGIVLVCLLALSFITHNQTVVPVNLLFIPVVEAKLAFWLIGFFVAGGLVGMIASMPMLVKEKVARSRLERRMQHNSDIMARL